jgi:hypothetical protein
MNRNPQLDMNESDWDVWNDLVENIEQLVERDGLRHAVVFHGTTDHYLSDITALGITPTIVSNARFRDEALIGEQEGFRHFGSFWATVRTAAWYAHSGVTERFGYGHPVLIAALTSDIENDFPLMPDKNSALSPVDPNARIHDQDVAERWFMDGHQRDWREAIDDIGAVYSVHHGRLPKELFRVISSIDDLTSMLEEKHMLKALF